MTLFGYDISQFVAGMLFGAALYHFLIRSFSGLFSRSDDYRSGRGDYRRRRNNNGFVLFLLVIAAVLVLAKMFSGGSLSIGDHKIWKDASPVIHDQPAPPPPSTRNEGIGEGASLYPPPKYVYLENENVPQEESKEGTPSTERYFVQTDCLDALDSAQERAESLRQIHGLPTGVMKKETDGRVKYAPFLGPFDSRSEADDANRRCCKFKGWVQPYRNIEEISW